MSTIQKVLLFFLLPVIAPILYPPSALVSGDLTIMVYLSITFGIILFVLGFLLLRGSSQALTLSIFLLGLNAINRILMFFGNATFTNGSLDIVYIITSVLSIGLSIYLLLRLDQIDIRTRMVK
jgi:hypothetical protein